MNLKKVRWFLRKNSSWIQKKDGKIANWKYSLKNSSWTPNILYRTSEKCYQAFLLNFYREDVCYLYNKWIQKNVYETNWSCI